MNTEFGERLSEAIKTAEEIKKAEINNPKNFIWKGPKKLVNGELMQEEVKLMDATPEQLNSYLDHCISMLNSTDKNNPGRKVLLDIIQDQRERCNAELYMRYVEGNYHNDGKIAEPRFVFWSKLKTDLDRCSEFLPKDQYNELLITNVREVPNEFKNLTLDLVRDGCLLTPLGVFDKKHITLNFICKLGLWLDDKEKKEFNEEAKERNITRLDIVKERCNLKPATNIKISSKGLLNFKEFRAMITLKTKRYHDLNIDQLVVLRDKVLFALENEVSYHITQWQNKIKEIVQVANLKGITLNNFNENLLS